MESKERLRDKRGFDGAIPKPKSSPDKSGQVKSSQVNARQDETGGDATGRAMRERPWVSLETVSQLGS